MRNLSTALIVTIALGMGVVQWAQSQEGLSSFRPSEMRLAVKTGSADRVRSLIQQGVAANTRDTDGYTPLHQASVDGFSEAVSALLATTPKPDVDAKTADGYTALHLAAMGATNGHLKAVEALLEADAAVDEDGPEQRTALHLAAWGGHSGIVKALLDEDAAVDEKAAGGWTPLHFAAHGTTQGHVESVRLLRDGSADRNIEAQDRKPWQYAWERKQRAIVDILNPLVSPALIDAVQDDDVDEVRDLIAAGYSQVNEKNTAGQPTVYLAVVRKRRDILTLLLAADDIDVDAKENGGYAPLHLAVHHQDSDATTPAGENLLNIVKDLIAAGADVNALGGTSLGALRPLTIAINRNNEKAAQALRDAGATSIPTGNIVFSPTGTLTVVEGKTADLGITLSVKPDMDVTISLSIAESRVSISKTSMTFTPSNWNQSQTVRLTSTQQDDDAADIDTTLTATGTDNRGFKFQSAPYTKAVKVDDDETVGFTFSRNGKESPFNERLPIAEGQHINETVKLSSRPTSGNVVLQGGFVFAIGDSNIYQIDPVNMSFTQSNWNVPQTVRLGVGNGDDDGDSEWANIGYSVTSTGNDYDGKNATFYIRTVDDDTERAVVVPHEGLTIAEGTSKTFTFRMGTEPVGNPNSNDNPCWQNGGPCATIAVRTTTKDFLQLSYPSGGNPSWITQDSRDGKPRGYYGYYAAQAVVFSGANSPWNVPQTITVTVPEDSNTVSEEENLRLSIGSYGYSTYVNNSWVSQLTEYKINVEDDDVDGQINIQPYSFSVGEGRSQTLRITLSAKPKQNIDITVSHDIPRATLSSSELTFTPKNWNTAQVINVIIEDEDPDTRDTANETGTITFTTTEGLTTLTSTVPVTVTDNEAAGTIVTSNDITVGDYILIGAGGEGVISIKLSRAPTYDTVVHIAKNNNNISPRKTSLTFTTANWNTDQNLVVDAPNYTNNVDKNSTIQLSTTGGLVVPLKSLSVKVKSSAWNGVPSFIVKVDGRDAIIADKFWQEAGGSTQRRRRTNANYSASEWNEGNQYSMTVKMDRPVPQSWGPWLGHNGTHRVQFKMSTYINEAEMSRSPTELLFDQWNWNKERTITLTIPEDEDADDELLTFEIKENASDQTYGNYQVPGAGHIFINLPKVIDNDVAGSVDLSTDKINAEEYDTNTFTVKLGTKPKRDTIKVKVLNASGQTQIPSDITFSPKELTFTPDNYNQAQTITVETESDSDTTVDLHSFIIKAGEGYFGQASIQICILDSLDEHGRCT